MAKRWKRWLAILAVLLLVLFGLTMLDPFFRQLVFGPRYGGVPLLAWQRFYRGWQVDDRGTPRQTPSLLDNIHEAVAHTPDSRDWGRLSGEDRRAILLSLADDPRDVIKAHVAAHLGEVPSSPEVVARLEKYTDGADARIRSYAAHSLGRVDAPAEELLPYLLKLLRDKDRDVRSAAEHTLATLGSRAPDVVVPRVVPLIRPGDLQIRLAALRALSGMKPAARETVAAVLNVVHDPDWHVRSQALTTLGFLQAREAVPAIITALRDPERDVQESAAYAARNIGPDAKAAIPALLVQVRTLVPSEVVYNVPALLAIGRMGSAARDAIPELLKLRSHPSEIVRGEVEKALSQIDPTRFPAKDARK